jgi:UDP:flavonoid glycosyltransferase YjiC (YdhE family)
MDRMYEPTVRQLRAELGLPAVKAAAVRAREERAGWRAVYGYSTAVLPRPSDWRAGLEVVGNWWPDVPEGAELPSDVEEFLEGGAPPVFIGFGSMGSGEGERLGRLAVQALRKAGLRGILQAGWAGLTGGEAHSDVLTIGELPHALLFPRVAAVVHHGGAGTTAAALRAGVPSLAVPVLGDQPFFGRRITALGAGPAPIPFGRLSADRLAAALAETVTTPRYRAGAAAIAERMAGEDGAGRAVELIERWAGGER